MNFQTVASNNVKDKKSKEILSVVIALTKPKVSEAWMARMTDYLSPSVVFVSIFSSFSHYEMSGEIVELVESIKRIPIKLTLFLKRKKILREIDCFLRELSAQYELRILCHYMTTATYLWPVLRDFKKHLYIHAHGHDVTWDRKWERYPFIPAHGPCYRQKAKICGRNSVVLANSCATICKLIENGIPKSSIRLKYLGVPSDIKRDYLEHKLDSRNLKIVYLGRLVDFKGPLETLKAFERMVEWGGSAELHFIGDGALRKKLEKSVRLSKVSDMIWIHGSLQHFEAMQYLSCAYIFTAHNKMSALTGQEEAYGVAVVEAMMLGVPVVTGRSGGIKETVEHNKTGILFDPGNIEEHARALYNLMIDSGFRDTLSLNAKKKAREYFSVETEAKNLRLIMNLDPV